MHRRTGAEALDQGDLVGRSHVEAVEAAGPELADDVIGRVGLDGIGHDTGEMRLEAPKPCLQRGGGKEMDRQLARLRCEMLRGGLRDDGTLEHGDLCLLVFLFTLQGVFVSMTRHLARFVCYNRRFAAIFVVMIELDETDRRLLALLGANARTPVAKLGTKLGLARTTVQARLDRLERNGVIAGYTVKLSEDARAGQIRATVLIHITPAAQSAVLRQLERLPAVERVHTTSGRFDLACQLRTQSTLALDETLDRIGEIDGVLAMESLIHLSTRIDRTV